MPVPKYQALILTEIFPPQVGGSGKWLSDIYSRQEPGKYIIICGTHKNAAEFDSNYTQRVEREPLSMASRSISNGKSIVSYAKQILLIWKKVRKHRPKQIHASRPLSEGLIGAIVSYFTGVRLLCFVHGEDINVAGTSRELRILTRFVLSRSKKIIANSSFTYDLLVHDWRVSKEKVVVMNPGIDCSRFTTPPLEEKEHSSLTLFTAGRLQKRKGHDTVIKSIPVLKTLFPDVTYVISGAGDELENLKKIAIENGVTANVQFAGEVSDCELVELYRECDIFILANREIDGDVEGFGIVLLEAQAAGKPVITGCSGGTKDTLLNGKTGFLINANNEKELIDTIRCHLKTKKQREVIGKAGRDFVCGRFDWNHLSKVASDIFESAS